MAFTKIRIYILLFLDCQPPEGIDKGLYNQRSTRQSQPKKTKTNKQKSNLEINCGLPIGIQRIGEKTIVFKSVTASNPRQQWNGNSQRDRDQEKEPVFDKINDSHRAEIYLEHFSALHFDFCQKKVVAGNLETGN